MNIDHLREFVFLAETLSFNTTAKHFFISQSVLSKHIAALEEDLGVVLFDRDRRHVEITDVGNTLYEDCVRVLNDWDHALDHISSANAKRSVSVRIGYLRNASRPFLPEFVCYMEKHHPDVDMELVCLEFGELVRSHRSHRVDIVFSMDMDQEVLRDCDFYNIYVDHIYAIVSKNHELAKFTDGVTAEQLVPYRKVVPRASSYPGYNEFLDTFVSESIHTPDCISYDDIDTLYMRVESGEYVGFSSGHNIRLYRDRVVFLPILGADTSYNISARWIKTLDFTQISRISDAFEHIHRYMANWTDGFAQ